jgi:hypothetical protein
MFHRNVCVSVYTTLSIRPNTDTATVIMPTSAKTLIEFVREHCTYIPHTELLALSNPSCAQVDRDLRCPICFVPLLANEHRAIRVDLDQCHHAFDADCLSLYLLAGLNRCPLCRTQWFDIPVDARTAQNVERAQEQRISQLGNLVIQLNLIIHDAVVIEDDENPIVLELSEADGSQRGGHEVENGFRLLPEADEEVPE